MPSNATQLVTKQIGGVLLIKINNPPANTWNEDSLQSLTSLIKDAEENQKIGALVITGSGEKFFSAGADLNRFAAGDKTTAHDMASSFGQAFETLAAFSGVTIAAINGYAMGGGLECALACDLRIAETHAQMALPETTVGLLPCGGGTQNLAFLVGEGWAKRMILCGEAVTAEKAMAIGLVEEVVPQGKALEQALALAKKVIEQHIPMGIVSSKQLIRDSCRIGPDYQKERKAFLELFGTQDQLEGTNAFLEKRRPKWQRNAT